MKMNRKLVTWIVVLLVLAIVGASGWYFLVRPYGSLSTGMTTAWNSLVDPQETLPPGILKASGTVETTVLSIGPEMSGKVVEVDFQEGDVVKAGAVLVQLDDSTLRIQRTIAAANLDAAKLSLQKLTSPQVIAALQKTIAQDRQAIIDAIQAEDIQKYFTNNADAIQDAQSKLLVADIALNKALDVYDKVPGIPERDTTKAAAYQQLYQVQQAYDHALAMYNLLTGVPNPEQVDVKVTAVALAEAKLEEDQTLLDVLNGGSILENATGPGLVQLQQARINVQVAQASLDLLDDQIGKMTITAPVDGVVMARSVELGSVVSPGNELLSLARLNDLTITVYIPEDSYRKIKPEQAATVSVDSFPGETFHAAVIYISNQPEFIPRTTKTVSGKTTTVYAIQLELQDAAGKLKPGMPADVTFDLNQSQ